MKTHQIVAVAVIVVAAGVAYLFRHTTEDNSALGIVTTQYHVGRPNTISVDVNRDGTVNGRFRISAPFGALTDHDFLILESFEDRDLNRTLEVHAEFDKGEIRLLEIDLDDDGNFDRILRGQAAMSEYEALAPTVSPE